MTIRFTCYLLLLVSVFAIGILRYKRVSIASNILTLLIGVTLVSEVISRILAIKIHNNIPIYHFISPIEFIGFSAVYHYLFTNYSIKKAIVGLIALLTLASVVDTLFFETLLVFPSKYYMVSEAIYLIYALLGFRQMLLNPIQVPIYKQSFFWLNTAMVSYTSTIFLSDGLHDYFLHHHFGTRTLNTFIYFINIIFYTLLGGSIITDKRQLENG
jgi:hypothetical protein